MSRSAPFRCEAIAPLLPSYAQGWLPSPDQQQFEEHLVSCSACQQRLQAHAQFDQILRAHDEQAGHEAPPTAWLLRQIGAIDSAAGSAADRQTRQGARGGGRPTRTHNYARPPFMTRAVTYGAVICIALAALMIFNGQGIAQLSAAWKIGNGHGRSLYNAPAGLGITAISMDTPDDGWAIGQYNANIPFGQPFTSTTEMFHFTNHAWVQAPLPIIGHAYQLNWLIMVSPVDGWASGYEAMLHYDGTSWRQYNDAPELANHGLIFVKAFTTDDIWGYSNINVVHFDGTSWTAQSIPQMRGMQINSMSMISPSEGWLLANPTPSSVLGTPAPLGAPSSFFYYHNGAWQEKTVTPALHFDSIAVGEDGNGWAFSVNGADVVNRHPVMLRLQDGMWRQNTVGIGLIHHFNMVALYPGTHGETWLFLEFGPNPDQLWHYDGTQWSQVLFAGLPKEWISLHSLGEGSVDSADGLWLADGGTSQGKGLILHYANNTWEGWTL